MSELTLLPLVTLAQRLRDKEISPVELAQDSLACIERHNPAFNAFVTVVADQALAQARVAEAEIMKGHYRGPLHGIPVAHKDLFCTRDIRTTSCSRVLEDYVPDYDATVVQQWRMAGTVLLGKLNMHEFAYGPRSAGSIFGAVRNPWRLDCHAGGSSGGSGVAVLMGMCAVATGTDSGGSVRMPAAATATSGLKPTFGLGSRYGVFPLMWTMDHPGVLARTALDCGLALQPLAGYDAHDRTTATRRYPDFVADADKGVRGLRIGIPHRYFYDEAEGVISDAVIDAVRELEAAGAEILDIDLPYIEYAGTASAILHLAEAAAYHDDTLAENPDLYFPETLEHLQLGSYILAKDYLHAQRFRKLLGQSFRDALRRVDVLITPTVSILTTPFDQDTVEVNGQQRQVHPSLLHNAEPIDLVGLPALSVPCGFSDSRPIGLQIVGRPFGEAMVIRVGNTFQKITDWHLWRPDMEGVRAL